MEKNLEIRVPFIENECGRLDSESLESIIRQGVKIDIDCVNWPDRFPTVRKTEVRVAHDRLNIYFRFIADDEDVIALTDCDLGPVANDSCVEFFVCPDLTNGRYWNFEFNVIGRKNVSTRIERPNPRRLSVDELSRIITIPSLGSQPFAEKSGKHKWILDVVIPLSLMGVRYNGKTVEMKANFYKCAAKSSTPHYLSYAPIHTDKPDFHRVESFVPFILE